MRVLIPTLSVLAALTTIVTAWWNLAIRRRVASARINHLSKDTVESRFARFARRTVTSLVLLFLCSALLLGAVIFLKSLWELFA